jgi:circadian clock protein KaiC
MSESPRGPEKLPVGIVGLDVIAEGGLPAGRTTLVAGTAGSAKTVFAAQFLAEGIARGEPGVFVTFEETPADLRRNLAGFGWDVAAWETERRWLFVDASHHPGDEAIIAGEFDLGALLARIEHAVRGIGARRVAIDSIATVFGRFPSAAIVRRELYRVMHGLRELDVTAVVTAERSAEYGEIARFGVEEFVADNVVILRNVLEGERRRRTVEILKFRGTYHQKGEYPFTIRSEDGILIVPLSAIELTQRSSNVRITSGIAELDEMCGGGFFRDSIILVSGATGTGKTLMVTEFLAGGVDAGERCLLFAFEESREQLFRNASGWGIDFERREQEGLLRVVCEYPERAGLEDHTIRMKKTIEEFSPHRVAVDSLSALERVSTDRSFREFVIGLTSFMKAKEVAGLFTSTTPSLLGGESVTERHISTLTDSIILLRYVEMFGEMRRGLTVLKMRGSRHDKDIREFTIDESGMHIGKPFRDVTGILSGRPLRVESELERVDALFSADDPARSAGRGEAAGGGT